MPLSVRTLLGCVALFAAVDVASSHGLVPGGSVSLWAAQAYLARPWLRWALMAAWASLGAVLDAHFAHYLDR